MPMIFERSADTSRLVAILRTINGEAAWDWLRQQVPRAKSLFPSARSILEKEGIFFDVIRGQGVKRMSAADAVTSTSTNCTRVAKAASRGRKKCEHIPFDQISQTDQVLVSARRFLFSEIEQRAKAEATAKPISEKVTPPAMPTLAAITGGKQV